jgi:hypothetical protein
VEPNVDIEEYVNDDGDDDSVNADVAQAGDYVEDDHRALLDEIFGADSDDEDDGAAQQQYDGGPAMDAVEAAELPEELQGNAEEPNHRGDDGEQQHGAGAEAAGNRYNLRANRAAPGRWKGIAATRISKADTAGASRSFNSSRNAFLKRKFGLNMTVRQAIDKLGTDAIKSIVAEMMSLNSIGTFEGVDVSSMSREQLRLVITSKLFLKEKYSAKNLIREAQGSTSSRWAPAG